MNNKDPSLQESYSSINSSTSSYSEIFPRDDHIIPIRKDKPIIMRSIPMNRPKTYTQIINLNNQNKNISSTMINSTHANTNLSRSNITAQMHKHEWINENMQKSDQNIKRSNDNKSIRSKSIKMQQNDKQNQIIMNQNLVKSTYEHYSNIDKDSNNINKGDNNIIKGNNNNIENNIVVSKVKAQQLKKKEQQQRKKQQASLLIRQQQIQEQKRNISEQKQQFENIVLDFSMSSMSSQRQNMISPRKQFNNINIDQTPIKDQIQQNKSEVQQNKNLQQNDQQVKQYLNAIKQMRIQQRKHNNQHNSQLNNQFHNQFNNQQKSQFSSQYNNQQNSQFNNQYNNQYNNALNNLEHNTQINNSEYKSQSVHFQSLVKRNKQLQSRIKQLQDLIRTQSQSKIIQRKANQIYTEFYHSLSKMITKFIHINNNDNNSNANIKNIQKQNLLISQNQSLQSLNQSLNMQKILLTIDKLILNYQHHQNNNITLLNSYSQTHQYQPQNNLNQSKSKNISENHLKQNINHNINQNINSYLSRIQQLQNLLQLADTKNSQLKNQLLQSTQNNINAIFNSEISASCCLQNQVSKINNQMNSIKQKINLFIASQNKQPIINPQPLPPQIIYLSPPAPIINPLNQKKQNKIIKIYTTKSKIHQSDQESDGIEQNENKKRGHSFSRKRKRSSRSQKSMSQQSLSSKSTKKRQQMSRRQIQNLKQAYNQTKNELNALIQTFSLISNSQNEMRGYFSQIKQDIIKNLNDKLKQNEQLKQNQQILRRKQLQQFQLQTNRKNQQLFNRKNEQLFNKRNEQLFNRKSQQLFNRNNEQLLLKQKYEQKIKEKQQSYLNQIQFITKQRQQDRRVIQNLNQKVIELINAIAVPQKVNQQYKNIKNDALYDDQIPISQISVSVDYLKLIEQLKSQKQKQNSQIQKLSKQIQSLKQEIYHLKTVQHKNYLIKNIDHSVIQSRSRKQSIINQLNGFTEMSIPSPLMINTNQNYHPHQKRIIKSNKCVAFNNNVSGKNVVSMQKILSQKLFHIESQKNLQNNFKVILQSKQGHIKHLEQQIINLQELTEFLKIQIASKQQVIDDLENYVSNLENRSINSISLSSPAINLPEPNLYFDTGSLSETIKNRYQNHVKNLKILLKETKNQNKILRQQLQNFQIQADQLTESNFGLKNSATHSQRTTKNFPNSSSPGHVNSKAQGQIIIRKRVENSEKYEIQRQEQKINNLAYESDLPQQIQRIKIKGKNSP